MVDTSVMRKSLGGDTLRLTDSAPVSACSCLTNSDVDFRDCSWSFAGERAGFSDTVDFTAADLVIALTLSDFVAVFFVVAAASGPCCCSSFLVYVFINTCMYIIIVKYLLIL